MAELRDGGVVEIHGLALEYSVSDLIETNNYRIDRFMQKGSPHPLGMGPSQRLSRERDVYPKTDQYQFQEFAGPVFEFGGYGDATIVDPYTLRRLWVGRAWDPDGTWPPGEPESFGRDGAKHMLKAMRRVLDVAEAVGFFDE